jgi:hypothetical protein
MRALLRHTPGRDLRAGASPQKQLNMEPRSSWLFPLMVAAAGSVMAFGCFGIAVIMGYLPYSHGGSQVDQMISHPTPLDVPAIAAPAASSAPLIAIVTGVGHADIGDGMQLQTDKPVVNRMKISPPLVN